MTMVVLNAAQVRAAMAVAADEKDPRYYLRGMYLDADGGRMVSTNGSLIYLANYVQTFLYPVIVPHVKVPAWATEVELSDFPDASRDPRLILKFIGKSREETVTVNRIEAKYPNYLNVSRNAPKNTVEGGLAIQPGLITIIGKAFGTKQVTMAVSKDQSMVYFTAASRTCEVIGMQYFKADSPVMTANWLKPFGIGGA